MRLLVFVVVAVVAGSVMNEADLFPFLYSFSLFIVFFSFCFCYRVFCKLLELEGVLLNSLESEFRFVHLAQMSFFFFALFRYNNYHV